MSLITETLSLFVFSSTLKLLTIDLLGLYDVVQSAHFAAASDGPGMHAVKTAIAFISIRLAGDSLASIAIYREVDDW